ncbi:dipeptidase [Mangrovibacterium diazotrophicum]|uniref:Membrane dipeptidase n=1 Tax=Mangrovibacterium diazotrophicum TaxID=1261403 RepID=A0A419W583_9BACT|nr:membrane dipeptidase [Mangrovibacterium diazotrophicum]RKD90631.1 membrane dipeptidase [Mangrovibacterium diazotrophicum]
MESTNRNWSRRQFMGSIAGAGAAVMMNPFSSWAKSPVDPTVAAIIAKTIGTDTHNHMDVPFNAEEFKTLQYDLFGEMKQSGFSAICMTFCVDRPKLTKMGEAYERFILSLDEMDEMLKANKMKRALNLADLKEAHKKNHPIVVQSVEGGHFIEGKIDRIEVAYQRGLRHLGLLHDGQSLVPLGDIYTNPPHFGGLTESGIEVVKECNRLGILVDLAHCSNEGIDDALKISTKPMLVSHTGLNTQLGSNEKMAQMMMPRLISKEQAKILANAGGVIGVWTHLADSPTVYAKNVRAMVDVVGADHVCIGTDSKMAPPSNSNERFGRKTNLTWGDGQEGFLYYVVDAMLKVGFTEDEIVKIAGGNYCRIFDAATSV